MINRIIDFCANNRFLVFLFVVVAVMLGGYAMQNTKLDAIPDLSDTQVIVYSRWDRSPDIMEDQVTYPIVSCAAGNAQSQGHSRLLRLRLLHKVCKQTSLRMPLPSDGCNQGLDGKLQHWDAQGRPGDHRNVLIWAIKEVGGPSFFALLVIAVSFRRIVTADNQRITPVYQPDPELGSDDLQAEMLIGEVKEGKAHLNAAATDPAGAESGACALRLLRTGSGCKSRPCAAADGKGPDALRTRHPLSRLRIYAGQGIDWQVQDRAAGTHHGLPACVHP